MTTQQQDHPGPIGRIHFAHVAQWAALWILSSGLIAMTGGAGEGNPPRGAVPDLVNRRPARPVGGSAQSSSTVKKLPLLPSGVTELKFSEFFVSPIGSRGLDATEKLRRLDGQRVRIAGYMVQREKPTPGIFLLAPIPPYISRFLPGQRFDLQATVSPDAGQLITGAQFFVDDVAVPGTVSFAWATVAGKPTKHSRAWHGGGGGLRSSLAPSRLLQAAPLSGASLSSSNSY